MTRLRLAAPLLLAAAACAAQPPASSGTQAPATVTSSTTRAPAQTALPVVSERARRLWRDAITVDLHNDMPDKVATEKYDPDVRHPAGFRQGVEGHTDLPRLVESGLTAVFMSAWVDAAFARTTPDSSFERAMQYVDTIHAFAGRHPDRLALVTTAEGIRRAKRDGKVAVLIGVEGGHAIENSLDNLRALHRRGARYLTLTWNNGNDWAGSSIGVNGTRTGGLTDFGREVVREMNRLGMLVDLSHVSEATFADAIAASSMPVIASHSSARAIGDHPRNLSDEQLRLVARNGGVVHVNFFSRFLAPGLEGKPVPFSVLLDHIEHIAKVAGVDHVGLGSDFDGVSALPQGMEDVTALPRIVQGLLDRGWSEEDVRKVIGGNTMRVMERAVGR